MKNCTKKAKEIRVGMNAFLDVKFQRYLALLEEKVVVSIVIKTIITAMVKVRLGKGLNPCLPVNFKYSYERRRNEEVTR